MIDLVNARRATLFLAAASFAACSPASQQADTTPSSSNSGASQTRPSSSTRSQADGALADSGDVEISRDAELAIDKSRYVPGGQVRMEIQSRTDDTLGFNPCNRLLEKQDGGRWTKVDEPTRMCTMELWLLEPRASRTATTDVAATLPKGTYRLVLLLSRQKTPPSGALANWGTVRAVSPPFALD
jgi:Big-like domain-containing protein